MRVFTTEGRRPAETLFKFACSQWPDDDIAVIDVCFPYFAKNYLYPRTLRYQDLPLVRPAQYRLADPDPSEGDKPIELLLRSGGVVSERCVPTIFDLIELCSNATSATFADRPFYQPVMTFQLFVDNFMPHLATSECAVIVNRWLPAKGLADALAEGLTTSSQVFKDALGRAQSKRYFDYNFHLNGNIVFGDLYRKLSGSTAPIHMSKNMVLVLYMLRKLGSVEHWGFERIMREWRGWKNDGEVFEIGTIPSRQSLVPNLVELGLAKTEKLPSSVKTVCSGPDGVTVEYTRDYHSLTDLGLRFLESLHPDCYDPFMPRRLAGWQGAGFEASKPQIDRYIKTYFGKQIRFQSKLFRD